MPTNSTILLVEDNSDDAILAALALRQSGVTQLQIVADGFTATQYLTGEGDYHNRERFPFPALILLDLHLPGISGFDLLVWIREKFELTDLPVIALTGSVYSSDMTRAYQLGASSFMSKPVDFDDLVARLKEVVDFWLSEVEQKAA